MFFSPDAQYLRHRRNFITNDPLLFIILCVHVDVISRKMFRLVKSCSLIINHVFWKMYLQKKTRNSLHIFPGDNYSAFYQECPNHNTCNALNSPIAVSPRERSGSVVERLTQDRRAVGSSFTGVTALWSLSKTHLS